MTTILKLGGSVITDKTRSETVDDDRLDQVVAAIAADRPRDLALIHGGGSFGHHHADTHDVSRTTGTRDADAVLEIHRAMQRLNRVVVDRLHERDVPAVPVHPFSAAHRNHDGYLVYVVDHVEAMIHEGFVPVLHGDIVTHEGAGATIVSGDELIASLAAGLVATRIGLCSTVPGVLDHDGDVIETIDAYDDVAHVLGASNTTDVTGGMAGKIKVLTELSTQSAIFEPDDLPDFLAGNWPGTTVRP